MFAYVRHCTVCTELSVFYTRPSFSKVEVWEQSKRTKPSSRPRLWTCAHNAAVVVYCSLHDSHGSRFTWLTVHMIDMVHGSHGSRFTWFTVHMVHGSHGSRFTWFTVHMVHG